MYRRHPWRDRWCLRACSRPARANSPQSTPASASWGRLRPAQASWGQLRPKEMAYNSAAGHGLPRFARISARSGLSANSFRHRASEDTEFLFSTTNNSIELAGNSVFRFHGIPMIPPFAVTSACLSGVAFGGAGVHVVSHIRLSNPQSALPSACSQAFTLTGVERPAARQGQRKAGTAQKMGTPYRPSVEMPMHEAPRPADIGRIDNVRMVSPFSVSHFVVSPPSHRIHRRQRARKRVLPRSSQRRKWVAWAELPAGPLVARPSRPGGLSFTGETPVLPEAASGGTVAPPGRW